VVESIALCGLAAGALPQILRRRFQALLVFRPVRSFSDVSCRLGRLVRKLARFRAPGDLLRLCDELLSIIAPRELGRLPNHLPAARACRQTDASEDGPEQRRLTLPDELTLEGEAACATREIGVVSLSEALELTALISSHDRARSSPLPAPLPPALS